MKTTRLFMFCPHCKQAIKPQIRVSEYRHELNEVFCRHCLKKVVVAIQVNFDIIEYLPKTDRLLLEKTEEINP